MCLFREVVVFFCKGFFAFLVFWSKGFVFIREFSKFGEEFKFEGFVGGFVSKNCTLRVYDFRDVVK